MFSRSSSAHKGLIPVMHLGRNLPVLLTVVPCRVYPVQAATLVCPSWTRVGLYYWVGRPWKCRSCKVAITRAMLQKYLKQKLIFFRMMYRRLYTSGSLRTGGHRDPVAGWDSTSGSDWGALYAEPLKTFFVWPLCNIFVCTHPINIHNYRSYPTITKY